MQRKLVALTRGLGFLTLILTMIWCLAGAGIYGSPLDSFHGGDFVLLILLLLISPLSILPAGMVGAKRPRLAGVLLLASSLLTFLLMLGRVLYEGMSALLEATSSLAAPGLIALLCGPQFLLGAAFLWEDLVKYRRRCAVGAGLLAGAVAAVALIQVATRPLWTVTVTPEGGAASSMRFDPRYYSPKYSEMKAVVDRLFDHRDLSGRRRLGKVEVHGSGRAGGKTVHWSSTLVSERTPKGLLLIRHNERSFHPELQDYQAVFQARALVLHSIISLASNEWRPAPSRN